MFKRRRRRRSTSALQEQLSSEADRLREEAKILLPCAERDRLTRKARQLEMAANIDKWLSSPGLQPPKRDNPKP